MSEHDENLRDLAAMFAMAGLLMRGELGPGLTDMAYDHAEDFMATRANRPERGIAAIKRGRKKKEAEE
jgi:hypothetical protein